MIERIKLKFGSAPSAESLEFEPGPITVVVGPNNSGKSKLIREILGAVNHGAPTPDSVILQEIALQRFEDSSIDNVIESITSHPNPGEIIVSDELFVGRLGQRHRVKRAELRQALASHHQLPSGHYMKQCAGQWYFGPRSRLLDGQGRIMLVNEQSFGDLNQNAASTFQQLFRDDDLRASVRKIIFDAIGLYLVVDPTNAGTLRLRLSERVPLDLEEEQSLTQRAANFHNAANLLSHASDGTKAFIGIIIEIMAGNPDLLLLDEPEAFLHPGLSYKLGLEMARQVQVKNKKIIVSTHSPNFLMGCVASGVAVNVIRLTYRNGNPTARILSSDSLSTLMKNPLLRSANVLSGLFFDSVILTEGDSDRAFYQEINQRLALVGRGVQNVLFVNANGKDAIPVMMEPLVSLGVPVAAIYDLDFVKDGGKVAQRRLKAAMVPDSLHSGLSAMRTTIKAALECKSTNYKRDGGAALLDASEAKALDHYLDQLARFGLFVVPVGEVEGWLADLDIGGHAANWLIPMFEKLGDEGSEDYIRPGEKDVWAFLDSIASWFVRFRSSHHGLAG